MLKRIITGAVSILILIPFIIFSDTIALPIGLGVCAVIAVWEVLHCVGLHKNIWLSLPLYPIALASPIVIRYMPYDTFFPLAVALIFLLMLYVLAVSIFSHGKIDITTACTALMTILYSTAGLSAIIYLRDFHEGGGYLYLLVFIGAWVTDIFAYFSGVLFGKHKLIPNVSPKKTVEGSVGGMLFCMIAFAVFTYVYNTFLLPEGGVSIPYGVMIIIGLLASVVSQIGDLSMSLLKRRYSIKDFGKIFPGHGGILDRFDSALAVAIILASAFGLFLA